MSARLARTGIAFLRWFDSHAGADAGSGAGTSARADWLRVLPFLLAHAACLLVIVVGWSPFAVGVAAVLYAVRMFAVTGFYHRYFSHRSFRTSRAAQFVFAVLGASAAQRGPLWWASHHRHHHRHADGALDPHSPVRRGFLWSHLGWIASGENFRADAARVRDFARFPELRFLDRFDTLVPLSLAAALYLLGTWLEEAAPGLRTSGGQLLVWGFFVSTIVLFHATASINSLAHTIGRRRYETADASRNSLLLALLTLGEGWHNNHHHYPHAARQGFFWWEIDLTYYALRALAALGVVWDLKPVPREVRA